MLKFPIKSSRVSYKLGMEQTTLEDVANLFLTLCLPAPSPFFIFQHRKTSVMAGDAIMVMRGLTKLSKAILETQAGQLRQVLLGGDAVTIAKTLQATAEEQFSSALGKVQVSKALCAQSSLMFCFFSRYFFDFVVCVSGNSHLD